MKKINFIFALIMCFLPSSRLQGLSLSNLYKFDLSLQYRIVYNRSSIPGAGGSTFSEHRDYEFFRQRFRLSLDIQPTKRIGGYAQLEFRGGWGVGPGVSDPREMFDGSVVFNRLKTRGIRYGYIYALLGKEQKLSAGILPVSDKIGDTLFSSDWDFNVGGISLEGKLNGRGYRLSYLRLVDTLGTGIDKEGEFFILDYLHSKFSVHVYFLNKNKLADYADILGSEMKEVWYALTSSFTMERGEINAFFMVNHGKYDGVTHTGIAFKGEGEFSFYRNSIAVLFIFTTGSDEGVGKNSFLTPLGIFGAGGYWAYTHIFTPQGPSDVNDFGLEIGNRGAGLFTAQTQVKFIEILKNLNFRLTGGIFLSDKKRNRSKSMGLEVGGEMTLFIDKYLALDFGISYARLGGFFGKDIPRGIYEIFSRFQMEF